MALRAASTMSQASHIKTEAFFSLDMRENDPNFKKSHFCFRSDIALFSQRRKYQLDFTSVDLKCHYITKDITFFYIY